MARINITSEGPNDLGLVEVLRRCANQYWLPDHATNEQSSAIILDSSKRKVAGEIELVEVVVK